MADDTHTDEPAQDHDQNDTVAPLELDTELCTVDSLLTERDSPLGRHFARLIAENDSDND